MAITKREKSIFIITVTVAVVALLYTKVLEPLLNSSSSSGPLTDRYQQYISLLDHKTEIDKRYTEVYHSKYWQDTIEKQQASMQMYMEDMVHSSGISEILNVRPCDVKETGRSKELSLQIDMQCNEMFLAKLLYKIATSTIPLQVQKLSIYGSENRADEVKSQIIISMIWIPGERK